MEAAGGPAEGEAPPQQLAEKRRRLAESGEDGLAEKDGSADVGGDTAEAPANGGPKRVKRRMALVFGFVGQSYRGLQINYEIEEASKKKSVEEVLRQALVRAGAVTALNAERLEQKIGWSRSSRTDQGVSAARIVVSAKLLIVEDDLTATGHCASLVADVNRELPGDVLCFSAVKVPNSFDAKRACSWREYEYLLPVEMARSANGCDVGLTADELAKRLELVMRKFEGCHSFHNFTRLKASDLVWKDEKEGKGSSSKGKGKSKGKHGKGKGKGSKRKFEEDQTYHDAELDADLEECEDGGSLEFEAEVKKTEASNEVDPLSGESALQSSKSQNRPAEPPWVEICAKDSTSGTWRERPAQVIKHTHSTIFMCTVEVTHEGRLLRIRLRGKFFLYNQIRLMVGSGAAVVAGALPEEFLDMALSLHIEMHMPLAPPTGLLLRTAGFCEMDQRAGFCAMDAEQATDCMLPAAGFVLVPPGDAEASASAFGREIEARVEQLWREGSEQSDWRAKLREVRVPSGPVLDELRAKAAAVLSQEAELRASQAAADRRRREDRLASGGSFVGVLPRRFAADLMVRFRLMPGWRVSNLQHALSVRLRRWEIAPEERPQGLSSPPETSELLEYIASVGIDALSEEGERS